MNDTPILKEKIQYFFDNNSKVHLTLLGNKFYNGTIKSIFDKHIILIDEKLGETPVFFSEINFIELRIKKEEEE